MTPRRWNWTAEEEAILRRDYPHQRAADVAKTLGRTVQAVYGRAAILGLGKSPEFLASPLSGRTRGDRGATGRFTKGLVPWNKGKPFDSGGRSHDTRFKKGERHGAANSNYVPIGSLRITKDGHLERKVTDDPSLYPARRWVPVHRLVWEAAHGPIPRGLIVVFRPGSFTNIEGDITADKLECISKAENMRRNTYHNYPQPIPQLVQLRGALQRKLNRRQNHVEKQD